MAIDQMTLSQSCRCESNMAVDVVIQVNMNQCDVLQQPSTKFVFNENKEKFCKMYASKNEHLMYWWLGKVAHIFVR